MSVSPANYLHILYNFNKLMNRVLQNEQNGTCVAVSLAIPPLFSIRPNILRLRSILTWIIIWQTCTIISIWDAKSICSWAPKSDGLKQRKRSVSARAYFGNGKKKVPPSASVLLAVHTHKLTRLASDAMFVLPIFWTFYR